MAAFNKNLSTRKDDDPGLFLDTEGRRLTSTEIVQLAVQIGAQAGLKFDQDEMRFRKPSQDQPRRVVAKGASRDLFYLYGIVSHPLRRQIVEMLGDEGPSGFTQIRRRLNVPVGTLYYHFDMLSALVNQDNQKRYTLTEAGRDAYKKLHSSEYVQISELLSRTTGSQLTPVERGLKLLVPGSLLASIQRRGTLSVLAAALILSLGAVSVYLAGLETIVLFVNPSDQTFLMLAEFLLNWLIVYGVADLLATYLFSRKGEHLTLLAGTALRSSTPPRVCGLVGSGWGTLAQGVLALDLRPLANHPRATPSLVAGYASEDCERREGSEA